MQDRLRIHSAAHACGAAALWHQIDALLHCSTGRPSSVRTKLTQQRHWSWHTCSDFRCTALKLLARGTGCAHECSWHDTESVLTCAATVIKRSDALVEKVCCRACSSGACSLKTDRWQLACLRCLWPTSMGSNGIKTILCISCQMYGPEVAADPARILSGQVRYPMDSDLEHVADDAIMMISALLERASLAPRTASLTAARSVTRCLRRQSCRSCTTTSSATCESSSRFSQFTGPQAGGPRELCLPECAGVARITIILAVPAHARMVLLHVSSVHLELKG